jgi:predicted metal-dependent hydrolase
MKAFFDKLSKENQNTSGSIRSLERSVMEVTEAVRENTAAQDEGNSLLKAIYKLNVKEATSRRTKQDREKRESERRSADTSSFDDQGAGGRYGGGFGGGVLGAAANGIGFNGLTALGVGALGIQSLISSFESLQNGVAETLSNLNPFNNEEEETTSTRVTKADLTLAVNNLKADKNANPAMLKSLENLQSTFNDLKSEEASRDKNTENLRTLNEEIRKLREQGDNPTNDQLKERKELTDGITESNKNIEESIKMMQKILTSTTAKDTLLLQYINLQRREEALKSGEAYNPLTLQDFKRRGGSISGDGNGDLINARLERGEYVLNKNAVDGIGVAALDKLNFGTLPRFQSGGFVGAPRSSMEDTGYKDASGRPILLAPYAAKAFKSMIEDGMPFESGSVNSVYRDEAEYNRLLQNYKAGVEGYGKPAANGTHNFGEGADIQAGSAMDRWIRMNGAKYGWYPNDYEETHGGHFEYKGPGAGSLPGTVGSGNDDGGLGGFFKNVGGGILGLGLGAISSVPILGDVIGGFTTGFLRGLGIETSNPLAQLFGSFAIGSNNGAPGQGGPGSGSGGRSGRTGTTHSATKWAPLLDLISSGEGGYTSMFPSESYPQMLDMTIAQLVDFQKQKLRDGRRSAAVGRYQFVKPENAARLAGLPMDALFSKENQDKMAVAYLENKRRGLEWLAGEISTREYIEDLAREWGAFKSYSGYVLPGNTGSIGPERIEAALKQVRGFNKGGLVPSPKDTVPAMLTPGEYVVPQETVSKVGAAYLRGLDNQINTAFREANSSKMTQQLSTMVMQPIIINGGGDSGGSVRTEQSEYIPSLMNNSGVDFSLDLLMTRHTLSSRIGG